MYFKKKKELCSKEAAFLKGGTFTQGPIPGKITRLPVSSMARKETSLASNANLVRKKKKRRNPEASFDSTKGQGFCRKEREREKKRRIKADTSIEPRDSSRKYRDGNEDSNEQRRRAKSGSTGDHGVARVSRGI